VDGLGVPEDGARIAPRGSVHPYGSPRP
jgi:hypothetical protein